LAKTIARADRTWVEIVMWMKTICFVKTG